MEARRTCCDAHSATRMRRACDAHQNGQTVKNAFRRRDLRHIWSFLRDWWWLITLQNSRISKEHPRDCVECSARTPRSILIQNTARVPHARETARNKEYFVLYFLLARYITSESSSTSRDLLGNSQLGDYNKNPPDIRRNQVLLKEGIGDNFDTLFW